MRNLNESLIDKVIKFIAISTIWLTFVFIYRIINPDHIAQAIGITFYVYIASLTLLIKPIINGFRDTFFKDVKQSKTVIALTLVLVVLLGMLMNCILTFIRVVPTLYGGDVIGIGSNQAVSPYKDYSIGDLIFYSLMPAFWEEIAFRLITYIVISNVLKVISDNLKSAKLAKYSNFIWLGISSILFALAHGPNITNLYLYFVPGILFGYLFLKNGLLASMICHMSYNYFSGLAKVVTIVLVKLLKG